MNGRERPRKSCRRAALCWTFANRVKRYLAADRPLAASVAELQEAVKSATQPEAKTDELMKIAEVQFQRKRYDEGVRELRRVWEEFPRSSFATKAMFRAAEVLDRVLDRKAEAIKTLEDMVLKYPTNGLSPKVFDFLKKPEGNDLLDEVDRATSVSRSAATASVGVSTSKFVRNEGVVIRHNMGWTLVILAYLMLIGLIFYWISPHQMVQF